MLFCELNPQCCTQQLSMGFSIQPEKSEAMNVAKAGLICLCENNSMHRYGEGKARQGKARQGKARQGRAGQGKVRQDKAALARH